MEVNQNQQMGIHLSVRLNLEGYLDSDRYWVCSLMVIGSSPFTTIRGFIRLLTSGLHEIYISLQL